MTLIISDAFRFIARPGLQAGGPSSRLCGGPGLQAWIYRPSSSRTLCFYVKRLQRAFDLRKKACKRLQRGFNFTKISFGGPKNACKRLQRGFKFTKSTLLEPFRFIQIDSWGHFRSLLSLQDHFLRPFRALEGTLGPFWSLLGAFWDHMGPSGPRLGSLGGALGYG